MFKFNKRNTRKRCEICSKLTIKRSEWRLLVANFEDIPDFLLVFLLLNLNKQMLGWVVCEILKGHESYTAAMFHRYCYSCSLCWNENLRVPLHNGNDILNKLLEEVKSADTKTNIFLHVATLKTRRCIYIHTCIHVHIYTHEHICMYMYIYIYI